MTDELIVQEKYWDREVQPFDAIYTHKKSRLSNFLDKVLRWDMYARFDFTLKHSEPIENRTFLDVGCGTGHYSLALARQNARRVVALDIAKNMIDVSARRAKAERLQDKISFVQTDLLQYHPDEIFDVCIGIGLFDYIRNARPVLAKMKEVTRSKVILSFPRLWTWRAPIRKVRLGLKGCGVYFYTKPRVLSLLTQAGFNNIDIRRVGKLYCVTATTS